MDAKETSSPLTTSRSPLRGAAAFLFLLFGLFCVLTASAADLSVRIEPRFNGRALEFDSLTNNTVAGQMISITRLDFLVSNLALRSTNGAWIENTNLFAFINGREAKTAFQLAAPSGNFDRIRFLVGLPSRINHADPTTMPANHPLNPEVNGLHWSWMGGYVFFALEGAWLRENRTQSGYSYHVATDAQLMRVELPLRLDLSQEQSKVTEMVVALNIDQIFSTPNAITLNDETATTHSRTNDPLAGRLKIGIEKAFAFKTVKQINTIDGLISPALSSRGGEGLPATPKVEIAPTATPHRFTMSRFFPQPALPNDNP